MVLHKSIDIGIYCYFGLCFICCVIVINWTITFYQLQKINIYLGARRPWITLTMGILSCIGLGIERIHAMLFTLSSISTVSDHQTTVHWKTTQTFMTHFTLILLQYIFLIRAWLTYYDIKFNQALQDSEWRVHIDPSESKNSWIINNRSTFGNAKYVLIICLFLCGSMSILSTIYVWINGDFDIISRAIIGLNALIPLMANILILCKLPMFYDIWKLRKEVKICVYSQCTVLASFLLYSAIIDPRPEHWTYLPLNIIGVAAYLWIDFIVFQWVFMQFGLPWNVISIYNAYKKGIYQFNINTLKTNKNIKEQHKSIGKFITLPNEEMLINNNNSFEEKVKKRRDSVIEFSGNKEKCSIRGILQHDEGIKLFARHIGHEFAIESLLFFVETQQYLDQLHSHPIHKKQIKLLHTTKCGLSIPTIPTKLALINQHSSSNSSSPQSSPIGGDTDLNDNNNLININQSTRAQSTSLSVQSISRQTSFWYDNNKYIHIKLPSDIPRSVIISSGYRKKVIMYRSPSKNNLNNKNKTNNTNNHNKNTPTADTPISDGIDTTSLPLQNNATGNSTGNSTGNNTPNYTPHIGPITPHMTPKKSPSLLAHQASSYQPALQLSPLESYKQYTKHEYTKHEYTKHEYHVHEDNASASNINANIIINTNSNTNSNTNTITRKTRSATKSTTNTMTSTISGGSFPDTVKEETKENISDDELYKLEPYDQAVLLFRKYIADSATFCINISSQCRKALYQMFDDDKTEYQYDEERKHYIKIYVDDDDDELSNSTDIDIQYSSNHNIKNDKPNVHDLYHCFDSSRSEIYRLLTGSLERFKLTGEFSEYLNNF